MPSTINLDKTIRGVVNNLGAATLLLSPDSAQEIWTINRIIVSCDGALASVAAVYRNRVDPSQEVATTISGNSDTDYQENLELAYGERVYVVWGGATPGSNVAATVQGACTIAGRIYQ